MTSGLCTLVGTVVTGFEEVASEECRSKLTVFSYYTERGKIIITIPSSEASTAVANLRGIDNLYVVGYHSKKSELIETSTDKCETLLRSFVKCVNWREIVNVWHDVCGFKLSEDEILKLRGERSIAEGESDDRFSFRVTCNRGGTKHSFTSMEAASLFGGEINDVFGWNVNLTKYNIEIVLWISDEKVYVMASLNAASLHIRNIKHFGPTTLRPTICHNMLRFGEAKPGDVICDPMCGGGSIPIESALCFSSTFNIAGDIHELAWKRTGKNVSDLDEHITNIDCFSWNACHLPLKDGCVDLFVTDLPFGKRSGSRSDNRMLYPSVLKEMARVCQPGTGRAVLLTHDRRTLMNSYDKVKYFWKLKKNMGINIGGLVAEVYLLYRLNSKF